LNLEKVKLPSNGLLYPEASGIGEYITIRPYTTAEEKSLYGSSGDVGGDMLIKKCIVDPQISDVTDLYTFDEYLLFVRLRAITLGNQHSIYSVCPACRRRHKVEINLDELEVKYVEESMVPFTCKLNGCGREVTLKMLTEKEKRTMEKKVRKQAEVDGKNVQEEQYVAKLMATIDTVDGETMTPTEKKMFVEKMSGADAAEIRKVIREFADIGLQTIVPVTCSCGYEYEENAIGPVREFFRI